MDRTSDRKVSIVQKEIETRHCRFNAYDKLTGNSKPETSVHLPQKEGQLIWDKNGQHAKYKTTGTVNRKNNSIELKLEPNSDGKPVIFLDRTRGTFRLEVNREDILLIEEDGSSHPLTPNDDILARPLDLQDRGAGVFAIVGTHQTSVTTNIKRTRKAKANAPAVQPPGLTIPQARELLATSLCVRPDQIEIVVRA